MRNDHHPNCRLIPYAELLRDLPFDMEREGLDPEWARQAGIMKCDDDCEILAQALGRGRELAEIYGW